MSFRSRLRMLLPLILGGGLLLAIWAFGALFATHSYWRELERAQIYNARLATSLAYNFSSVVANIDVALRRSEETLAREWQRLQFERYRALDFLAATFTGLPQVTRVLVTDPNGVLLFDSRSRNLRGIFPLPRDYVPVDAGAAGGLLVGPAVQAGDLSESIGFSRHVMSSQGERLGTVTALVRRDFFMTVFNASDMGTAGQSVLYRRQGRVVESQTSTFLPPERAPDWALQFLAADGPCCAETRVGESPQPHIVTYHKIEGFDLLLGVAVGQDRAMDRWREDTRNYTLLGGLLSLVVIGAMVMLHRSLDRQQQAIRLLSVRESQLHSIFTNAGAGIVLLGRDGTIHTANDAFARIVGRRVHDLIGVNIQSLTHPEDIDRTESSLGAISPVGLVYEKRYLRPNGAPVWVEVSLTPQGGDEDAGSDNLVAVITDISVRRVAEQNLAAKADELARSNTELEQFAYVASHDLQEPLRMVVSYLQLLERRHGADLSQDGREYIAFAVRGAHRMSSLIRDLLDYSRAGRGTAPLEEVDARDVLTDVLQSLKASIEDAGAVIRPFDGQALLTCRQTDLSRLFVNLIGNALKYRAEGRAPEISITCEDLGTVWEFAVKDNGIGFPPEYEDRIFKLFQRLHPVTEYEGTGIGLAICRKLVDGYGGRIWCSAQEGQGATFFFQLPKAGPVDFHGAMI